MPERSCTDCRWAKWVRTKAGLINHRYSGRCTYQVEMPFLPAAITTDPGFRFHVSDEYIISITYPHKNCPTWAPKDAEVRCEACKKIVTGEEAKTRKCPYKDENNEKETPCVLCDDRYHEREMDA